MICPRGIEMDSATVQDVIYSLFESTPSLKDSAKIIDKLNQFMQFDSPLGEGKGRRVEELLKRCPNLKKIIIFRVISKAKPHKECQMVDFTWLCNSRSCYSCLLFSSVFNLCSQLQVLWAKHVMVTSFFWFVVQ
ncbi:hypothetical protein ES319_A07G110400v1 [Gossypium barbadense]|uniref:Uncharacterized protein n=4 Tax=Gossypium TaxID=3633 RepID=A0A5J5V267_GOSBA|nr:hypothetical protein ES319_A07G110400v1 [Gossypium barbadense]